MKFTELGIEKTLEGALLKEKITEPTKVQVESAAVLLAGKDAYISSPTGTGKTLAYLLPLLSMVDSSLDLLQVIVIAPTHELVIQIQEQVKILIEHSGLPIRSQAIIGGVSIQRQKEKLKAKPHVIIGSPGRILDLISARKLKVHHVTSIVLDEVDRLLFGEVLESIGDIIRSTLKGRQLIFVSATVRKESAQTAAKLSPELVNVHIDANRVADSIRHLYFVTEQRDKPDLLRKLIHAFHAERSIVFLHRNENADQIAAKLAHHKLSVAQIHSACDKITRQKALKDFRGGNIQVLISSDISARGLDVKGVTHIFNLDIPANSKDYLHRVGRTGRAGASGFAVSLMTEQELRFVERYSHELHITMIPAHLKYGKIIFDESRN